MTRDRALAGDRHGRLTDAGLALVRVAAGLTLSLAHGTGKVMDLGKFTQSVADKGFPVPGLLAPAAALSEFLGGLLLALGLLTRPAATMVFVTMMTAALWVHREDPFKRRELALLYATVSLAFVVAGPGRYSADARLARRARPRDDAR